MLLLKGRDYCFTANLPINALIFIQRKWEAMPPNTQSKEVLPLNYFEHLSVLSDTSYLVLCVIATLSQNLIGKYIQPIEF